MPTAVRASDSEIDPAAIDRTQHAERFGDLQRAVVRQHDAAAADSDAWRRARDGRDERFGARAREHRRAVMFGHPVAVIPKAIGERGEIDGVAERDGAGGSLRDGRLIEHAAAHTR